MLGAGIKTTADIEITLHLNKTAAWNAMKASVKELKASLNDLAKTVGIEKGVKNYAALERELKKVQRELEKTKGELREQEQAAESAGAELIEMVQAAKGVTYQFSTAGKVIGAMAHEIDEADKELRGLDAALDMVGKETKEEIQLDKQLSAAIEGLQRQSSEYQKEQRREIVLGAQQDRQVRDFMRTQANRLRQQRADETAIERKRRALERLAAANRKTELAEKARGDAARKAADDDATLIGRINKYEKVYDAVFRASFRLKMAGNDLMYMSRRALDSVVSMMNEYGEFEFMLNRASGALSVQTGMFSKLEEEVLDLSAAMRLFPAKDVAQALYFWGSTTGQVVETEQDLMNTMSALEPVMQAAAMTNTNYEDTIKGVYSILAQYYNGAVAMAGQVTEQLFYITQKTAAEFPDLINSFKMVGPIAKANNVSFQDMVNLFGRLADLGVRGSMAGRAFRQMFIQMLRPSGPAIKAINNLFSAASESVEEFNGKSYYELMFPSGEFIGTEGYLKNLALAVRSLTAAERNSFLAKIATANELPVLTALVNDQIRALDGLTGAQDKNITSSQKAAQYFQDNWNKLKGSWKGIVGALKSTYEALKMQVASIMADVFTEHVNKITEIIEAIRTWAKAPENKELITFLGKLAVVAGVATAAVGAVLTLTGALIGLGAAVIIAMKAFAPFIPLIGGIVTAVITLTDAFIRNFDEIKGAVDYAVNRIADSLGDAGMSMEDLADVVNSVTEPIRGLMDILVKSGTMVIRVVADMVATLNDLGLLLPMLKGIAAVMAAMFAARAVTAVIGMTKAIGMFSLGLLGMGKAADAAAVTTTKLTGVTGAISRLKSAVGVGGLATIILGVGFMAYESNLFGFADGIDKLTDSFRNLREEVDQASSAFGENSNDVLAVAREYTKAYEQFKNLEVFKAGTGAYESGYRYGVTFADDSYTPYTDIADAQAAAQAMAHKKMLDVLAQWKVNVDEINVEIEKYTTGMKYTTQDYGSLIDRLFPFFKDEGVGARDALEDSVSAVLQGQAIGGLSAESMKPIFEELALKYSQIAEMGFDQFIKVVGENRTLSQVRADQVAKARAAVYQPAIDALDKLIGDGASGAEIEKFLVTPYRQFVGNMEVGVTDAIATVAGANGPLDEYQRGIWQAALQIIGKPASELDGMEREFDNILEQQWRPVTDQINEALTNQIQSTMFDSMQMIDKSLTEIANQLPYSGIQGGATKSAGIFNEMIDIILENKLKLPSFASEAIQSIGDYLASKGALTVTDYTDMETALKISMENAGETAAEIVQRSFSEFVDAFTNGVDAAKGLKAALKAAGDRGSNVSQFTKLMNVTTKAWFKKALRSGNLQQRQLAKQFLIDRNEALIGVLGAGGNRLDRRLTARLSRGKKLTVDIAQILVDNTNIKGNKFAIQKKILKKLGRFDGTGYMPTPEQIAVSMFGSGGKDVGQNKKGKKFAIDLGSTPVSVKTKIEIAAMTDAEAQAAIETAARIPLQNVATTMKIDATPAGKSVVTSFTTGVGSAVETAKTTINGHASAMINGMANETIIGSATSMGDDVGRAFGMGVGYGINAWANGMIEGSTPSGSIENIKASLNQTQTVYNGGYSIGKSWASGFRTGLINNVEGTLISLSAWIVGNSPPPAGPLKNVDKGGANIGTAWAEGLTNSAEKETLRGMKNVRKSLDSKMLGGSMGVETTISRKKEIDININIKSDGSRVDKDTASQLRRGVYDALVDNEILSHMVTIS